jgi:haloalkane dehalogenase
LNLDGVMMHYLDEGEGDPVVMLHGNPTWSFFYRNLILGLKGQCRTIVPDHVGCGMSDKPDEKRYNYSLSRRVQDLESLLSHLKVDRRITLVVHDWGGMIGMAFAARHPDRISRLVVMNTAAFHLPKTKKLPLSLWLCRNTPLDNFLIRDSGLFCKLTTHWCCSAMTDRVREGYLSPYATAENRLGQLRFVQDIPLNSNHPSYALVSEVEEGLSRFEKTPTLIMWGEKDFVFDLHFLAEWQRRLPSAEVHRFPDAGHLVLEDAGDEILSLIKGFFKRHPSGA